MGVRHSTRHTSDVALRPYSIGAAARLAGIAPDTLRAWERRYAFIVPGRTVGGHRLYSEEDVDVLRAVRQLVDRGARVGSLALLDPVALMQLAADAPPLAAAPHEVLVEEILEAARTLDTARAAALLDRPRLLTEGREVVRLVYLPLLRRVGERYEEGTLSVAVEHFVEKLVTARIHAVLSATPSAGGGRLALCACPPGERHEGGLLAAAVELRAGGFEVTLLGADTPVVDLVSAATTMAPAVIVLAVTNRLKGPVRRAMLRALDGDALRSIPLILGGLGAADLARSLKRGVVLPGSIDAVAASALRAT